jgi:uncharacterized protein YkwD
MFNNLEFNDMETTKRNERRLKLVILLFCVLFLLGAYVCNGQNDSIQKIEKLAAKKFCDLLNRHRIRQGLSPIKVCDTLCLVAKNHNDWLIGNNSQMTHYETPNTDFFSGVTPSDRGEALGLEYGLAEVITYVYSKGKTIDEISDNLAKSAFENWNMSMKGHHQIIFGKQDKQGVSFKNGWATAVFMRRSYY